MNLRCCQCDPPHGPSRHVAALVSRGSHTGDHRSLVSRPRLTSLPCDQPLAGCVDGVIVPTNRRHADIGHAIKAALLSGAHLVVLASGQADVPALRRRAAQTLPAHRVHVARLPEGRRLPGMHFAVDRNPLFLDRTCDTAVKRNIGLILARTMGWRRVLFLDDDVMGFGRRQLTTAAWCLRPVPGPDRTRVVGWAFPDFPDNSLVCHAFRLAGGTQSTFIGGGAMLVELGPDLPFFPTAYNEDWLFLEPLLQSDRSAVILAGDLQQRGYDPFERRNGAQLQEAGDLLAEGLFARLHQADGARPARGSVDYWQEVLTRRATLIEATRLGLSDIRISMPPDCPNVDLLRRAERALDEAVALGRTTCRESLALELSRWAQAHTDDLRAWRVHLRALPRACDVTTTLRDLGLSLPKRSGGPYSPYVVPAAAAVAEPKRLSTVG